MTGQIIGGWGYVWAAYTASAIVLGAYAISLYVRLRHASGKHEEPLS